MLWSWLWWTLASATSAFQPDAVDATFRAGDALSADGVRVWSSVERHRDDGALFSGTTPPGLAWDHPDRPPGTAEAFGAAEPDANTFLLYASPRAEVLTEAPVLLFPTAGDHPTPAFGALAARLEREGRPVYAVLPAHGFIDLYAQAEILADAIARVRAVRGAATVDVLAHGTGALATTIYLSNLSGTTWGSATYVAQGTRYREDVTRAVLVGAPLGGVDTPFRWPETSRAALRRDAALAPSVWSTYYPDTWQNPATAMSLDAQDLMPSGGDDFPAFRQMIAPFEEPAPWEDGGISTWSLQRDGWTTRAGGLGTFGESPGLDAVLAAGGDLLGHLSRAGVAPAVELHLVAGDHPVVWTEHEFLSEWSTRQWNGVDPTLSAWTACVADLTETGAIASDVTPAEIEGLVAGAFSLGEASLPSDGWVPVRSAVLEDALEARGLVVASRAVLHLSHRDLVRAGLASGAALAAEADVAGDPWRAARAQRWMDEDALGWYAEILEGEVTLPVEDDESEDVERFGLQTSCGCAAGPRGGWWPIVALAATLRRRRR